MTVHRGIYGIALIEENQIEKVRQQYKKNK
jgi:hypothetical protein